MVPNVYVTDDQLGALTKKVESVLQKLTAVGKRWPVVKLSVVMHWRAAMVSARHPYLMEKDYA